MSREFEACINAYLASIFVENLRVALKEAGFDEALRIPEPHVAQYQRGSDIVSLRTEGSGPHHTRITLESETLHVDPFLGEAAVATIVEICDELLTVIPWVDEGAARQELHAWASRLLVERR